MERVRIGQIRMWGDGKYQKFLGVCLGALLSTPWLSAQVMVDNPQAKTAPATTASSGTNPGAGQTVKGAHPAEEIAPSATVVTVSGVCERAPNGGGAKSCKTQVTRAEMDTVLNALAPNASPAVRRQLAIDYAKLLAAAGAAEKLHLDKDPEVVRKLAIYQKLTRMQVLADRMYRQIETKASEAQPAALRNYYTEHAADFEEAEVQRLSIPKSIVSAEGAAQELEVLKGKMEALRTRAESGVDFDLLQQEIYRELGIKADTPSTTLKSARRMSLPVGERVVFDLKAGQLTPVIDLPNALVLLKLVSKQTIPITSAKSEMVMALQREQLKEEAQKATESAKAEFNLKYFGLPANPELFPPPQVTGLLAEQSTAARFAQRTQPGRQSMPTRRHEVTIRPTARP